MAVTIVISRVARQALAGLGLPAEVTAQYRPGDTVETILTRAGLPAAEFEVCLINGKVTGRHVKLADGDVVKLFPIMAGG